MENRYFTSDEMYQFDQFTMNKIGIPSPVLMERAAHSVFIHIIQKIKSEDEILIIAGTGNNGGDAVALARMLFLLDYQVKLYIISKENHSEEMKRQVKIAQNINLPMTFDFIEQEFDKATYLIEGIFGIGISREIEGVNQSVIQKINEARRKQKTIVSLDIPSGLSSYTGEPFTTVIQADITYTFGFKKHGMQTDIGKHLCGEIVLCDIGYPEEILAHHFGFHLDK